ncbi:MAG: hypothetical protein WAO76_04100 [Georgfuchsia sp.]
MSKNSLLSRVASLLAALFVSSVAFAMVVFDPTNFVKNSVTAAQTSAMYGTQLNQYSVEIQHYMAMMRNLQQVPANITQTAVGREMVQEAGGSMDMNALLGAGGRLLNVYQSSSTLMNEGSQLYQQTGAFGQDMNRMSVASSMSWDQILLLEKNQAAAGRGAAQNRYQQAEQLSRQVYSYQTRADQQVQQAGSAQGAVDALGAVAALNHTMTDQMSGLTLLMANRERAEAVRQDQDAVREQSLLDAADAANKRSQAMRDALQ